MANTTNFGWETPDDTDLVKDGAAAIRTLGQAIDTSMQDLEGGTTGQILAKNSNADMDFVWVTNDVGDITEVVASTPLTGGGSSGSVTVGIQDGTTAQKGAVQLEDSTSSTSTTKASTPNSVKSAYDLANAAIPKSLVDAAGDLIYATANDTPARLAIGTAGQVLKVNSGATAPEWGAASAAASFVGASAYNNANQSISNATWTVLNFNSENFDTDAFHSTSTNTSRMTIPSGKNGKYMVTMKGHFQGNSTGDRFVGLVKNGSSVGAWRLSAVSGNSIGFGQSVVMDLVATDYLQVEVYQDSGVSLNAIGNGVPPEYNFLQVTYLGA
jgi:hypothetical protein